jgi:hypothetical protein
LTDNTTRFGSAACRMVLQLLLQQLQRPHNFVMWLFICAWMQTVQLV